MKRLWVVVHYVSVLATENSPGFVTTFVFCWGSYVRTSSEEIRESSIPETAARSFQSLMRGGGGRMDRLWDNRLACDFQEAPDGAVLRWSSSGKMVGIQLLRKGEDRSFFEYTLRNEASRFHEVLCGWYKNHSAPNVTIEPALPTPEVHNSLVRGSIAAAYEYFQLQRIKQAPVWNLIN